MALDFDVIAQKRLPVGISEASDLFSIDPHEPDEDDDQGDGRGDGPEDPELRRYNDAAGIVRGGREEGIHTEDSLSWG